MGTGQGGVAYFDGAFVPRSEVRISPDDRGFLLSDGVYEVVRAYDGRPFRLDLHLERLARSLRELRIGGVEVQALGGVVERLFADSGLRDATCYLQVTRGAAPRRHAFPEEGTPPTVYAFASPLHVDLAKWEGGVAVTLVPDQRWARCDIKTTALLPNVLANQRAKELGVEEAVFVRDGFVTEGSHTNVAAVIAGRLFTYPESNYILSGVTRRVVLDLCAELGVPITERPVSAEDLCAADEVLLLSTTSEVLPVVSVDGRPVGSGKPGPVGRRLLSAYRALAHGGEHVHSYDAPIT
jgi:D-alanine transaminase